MSRDDDKFNQTNTYPLMYIREPSRVIPDFSPK